MFKETQIELNQNKRELTEYQNRWQCARKLNDENSEKITRLELENNNLSNELKINKGSLESKIKEINRINNQFKQQHENLIKNISELADNKSKLQTLHHEFDKIKQENESLLNDKNRLYENIKNKDNLLNKIKCDTNKQQINLQNKINQYENEINKLQQINKKYNELINKYQLLEKENKNILKENDEKEDEILNLKEQIEDLYIKFEKEQNELQCKLNDTTNNLCKLENGNMQMMWPIHCVQGSKGAKIHKDLIRNQNDKIILKGMDPSVDSYSAFMDC